MTQGYHRAACLVLLSWLSLLSLFFFFFEDICGGISFFKIMTKIFFLFGATTPQWARASSFTRFLHHTQWHTTVPRTLLDEWLAHCRDHYLTTHNTDIRQTPMPPGWIWTHSLSRRAAADLCLRSRGHWYQHDWNILALIIIRT